jgi:hypothetical protein|tara:strand:- start:462 stop:584 length:123 start_codon:yes stop_codon:yes gene_type:complete
MRENENNATNPGHHKKHQPDHKILEILHLKDGRKQTFKPE